MEIEGIPDCLFGGNHDYINGVCRNCGESFLARTPWVVLKITKCGTCGKYISPIAQECPNPKCKSPTKVTTIRRINNFYLFILYPVQRFLFSPRSCGISFLEQTFLVLVTALGISFSGYIRDSDSINLVFPKPIEFLGAIVISFCVIPALFKEPSLFKKELPFIYRTSLAFQKGVFSDLIIQAAQVIPTIT